MEDLKEYFEGYMKDSITGELFHGSPKKLDVINPHVSSHGMAYVYASPDYKYALCYAGQNWNDFEINQAYVDGQLCLTEIQKGKFIEKFQRPGYVYHLNKDDFKMIPNHPKKEFISEEEVVPLTVDEIPNVYRRLSSEGIQFYTYPDLPPYIKDRKQYIMDRAKSFYVQDNPQLLEYLCKSFPDMEDDFRSYCTSYTGKGKKSEISTEGVSETADIPGENEENLETYTEGTILGSKDKMYNMDLWGTKANQKNVLFVTGLIGSGKSWTAKAIANKYNATWFSLDWLYQTPYAPGMKDPKAEALLDRAIESSSLFRKFVESGYSYDKLAGYEKEAINASFKGARDAVIKAAESDKNHLYVIEGIQVIWYMSEFSLASYPILFKGASVLKSAKQSIKRGVDLGGKFFDKFFKEVKEFPNSRNDDKRMREMIHAFEEFARILDDVDASMKKESVDEDIPKVYFTRKITPESLIRLYHLVARDKNLQGKVMVKISTGEPGGHNFLQPSLIGPLVNSIHGTICDANTAYEGARQTTESHYQVMKDHGFSDIAPVDVLDADGEIEIPVNDGYYLKTVPVGSHNSDYGTFLILSHFKGHAMAGFGGAMKNIAIGMASRRGKAIVHSGGKSETEIMGFDQQVFLKSMVDSLKASIDYGGRDNFLYINVANNLSVDCDCDAHPAEPTMADIGVFASTDPLAIDQACIDAVDKAADNKDLVARIKRQTGRNMLQYAEDVGIGSRKYELVDLDKEDSITTEAFKECNTLEDAIDNVFSHNSVVALWTDGENEDGSHCGYNVYHGMAHAIPDKFRKCEIQKIEDILDTDHPDAIHIRIDAGYMTPSKFEEFKLKEIDDKINDLFKEYSDPPHREEPMNTTPEQTVPSSHSFLRNNDEEERKPAPGFSSSIKKESVSDLDDMFKEAVESFTATTNEDAPIMKTDLNDLRKDFSKKSEENTDESAGVMEFLPYVGVKKDPPPDTDYPGSPFKALEESYETIFEFKNESANETVTVMETPFSPNSVFLNVGDYHYPDIIKELVEDVITDIENGSSDYAEKSNLVWHITGENSEPLCAIADELGFVQIPNIDPKKSDTVTYAMDIQEFTPEKTQYTSEAGADVSNIFRADEDYVYLNVPYCEFYIPTEYFAMGKKFAEDFTEKIHVIGLFNVGIFEDGKLVDVRVFNVPVYLDINVYEFEVRMIDIGSGTPIECRVYKYYQDSIICRAFIAENSGVAQTFLQLIISGNMPGTIPYSQVLSVWRKNLELSGVNLGVSSAIMEMILAVMYRDAKDPSKKYCIRYGSTADSSEFDYMSASIRQICQYNSTFTGIIYEDIDSMITSAINRNRNGKEEGDTPMEKIIKM